MTRTVGPALLAAILFAASAAAGAQPGRVDDAPPKPEATEQEPRFIAMGGPLAGDGFGATLHFDARLVAGFHMGAGAFALLGDRNYAFVGARASYRFRFDAVAVAPFVGLGYAAGGDQSIEYGGIQVDSHAAPIAGIEIAYSLDPFVIALEGAAALLHVEKTDGIYLANPKPPEQRLEPVPYAALMFGVEL